jgi:serine/threonine protein kinase/Leucine-rich repeat (LRR) protein
MASSSQVESIFFEALERKTAKERADYLDEACGADTALRLKVERLLKSHPQAMDFLAEPAVDRRQFDSDAPSHDLTSLAPTSGQVERSPNDRRARAELNETLSQECGEDVESALSFLLPSEKPGSLGRLAHYEVLEVLGNGGFGTVVKAFDEKLHRFVAIKLMSPFLAATAAPRKRFVREARSAAAVRHENVIAIYAVEDEPIPYLVMDFIAGRTLQQKLEATGALDLLDVLKIGRQIAAGLTAAHAMGLIHRDIKPGNILLEDGALHVKITDFGLARAADDASITQSGFVAGTPMFMAPEQAQGEPIDQRADLFSLGSVLYTMCSGRPPFRAANTLAVLKRVVEDAPRPIREIIPGIPEWLCELISVLHAKNPADRTISAQNVADLLAQGLVELQGLGKIPPVTNVPKSAEAEVKAPATSEIPTAAALKSNGINSVLRRASRWPRFFNRRWAAVLAVALMLLGCLGLAEATGVTDFHGTVIRLLSPEGTLVVEVDDPRISVKIDGPDVVITGAGAREIRLTPGNYLVEARKDGKVVSRELVTVTKNGRRVVRVSHEAPTPVAKAAPRSADVVAWERVVAALSAAEQVKAFTARMKELNPNFDGAVVPTIENGVVRELAFNTDDVTDLSPVRAFGRLRALKCSGFGDRNSPLTDLSPLSGLPLRTLVLAKGEFFDLSPLRGMPLTEFSCYGTRVTDLSPLQGMKLRVLNCDSLHVSDFTPLKGMPLEELVLSRNAEDLNVLAGMSTLEHLCFERTTISDISPLLGLKLHTINMSGSPVSELSPLKGMKLTFLHCSGTKVSDLSPLNGMPLKLLNCSGTKVSDASLASIKGCNDLIELLLAETQVSDAGLAHLKALKNLKRLDFQGTKVSTLSPLEGMALEEIRLTPKNITKMGWEILRNMKSLKTIGIEWNQAWPAAEFWARHDEGEFTK